MITFLRNKLWGSKWLVLCLIIGNVLLVGIVSGTPIYITATMQRVFLQELRTEAYERNTFPASMQLRFWFNSVAQEDLILYYQATNSDVFPWVASSLGIPIIETIHSYAAVNWPALPVTPREYPPLTRNVSMLGAEFFENNVRITHGRLPSHELVDGNVIEAIAHEVTLSIVPHIYDDLMVFPHKDNLYFRIVGVFDIPEEAEAYWSLLPFNFRTATFLVSDTLMYERFVLNYQSVYNMFLYRTALLDFTAMHVLYIDHYLETIAQLTAMLNDSPRRVWAFTQNFERTLEWSITHDTDLGLTMWILQIHVFIMLALYIYMVSRQILQIDTNDISVLRSRGASRRQILQLYVMQGIFIAAVSFPLGIALGVGLCHILGLSNGFLELVQRESLDVVITNQALLYGAGALFLSFLTMFIPVISFSRVDVVENKLTKRNKPLKPFWQRYFLDILLFCLSLYGLYTFGNQQELLSAALLAESPGVDPLLYLSSSLFVVGTGLLCLRIFPYLMKLVFLIGRSFWSPSLYVSMLKIIRSTGEEKFIMLFLIFSVSIGIYNAQVARTINLNNEHLVRYIGGSDIIFREPFESNAPPPYMPGDTPLPARRLYFEPRDFSVFQNFDEVIAATPVIQRRGELRFRTRIASDMQIMSIDTKSFGETVWFRDDLLNIHINYFLNALAMRPNGVLLSDNFRTALEFEVGDTVLITEETVLRDDSNQGQFVIVGFVDYWPNFAPVQRTRLSTGEIVEVPMYLAVLNKGYTTMHWGLRPYQVWMRTNTPSSLFLRDFIYENRIFPVEFYDANAALAAVMNDPIVQGTNGVLTVGFIVILLVCFFGFLIYWILSIRSRILQFGIFRAMGMGMRSIINLLINEQIFITFTALAIGAVVGEAASRLFVPLIQIAYTAAQQVIPILIIVEMQDIMNIFTTLGVTILFCMIILTWYISKIKIDQALKLGED